MPRMRVLDLARELGLETATVILGLREIGVVVKNHFFTVTENEVNRFREYIQQNPRAAGFKSSQGSSIFGTQEEKAVPRMRVLDLARELGLETATVILRLREIGVVVKNHFFTVTENEANRFREHIHQNPRADRTKPRQGAQSPPPHGQNSDVSLENTSSPENDDSSRVDNVRIEDAIRTAIQDTRKERERVFKKIEVFLIQVERHQKDLSENWPRSRTTTRSQVAPDSPLLSFLHELRAKILDIRGRQEQVGDTFNIVCFGRTGVGKSSLIEALTQGDGASVSRGESDWTTDVRPVPWNNLVDCHVWDTPGINGWGRTVARSLLEERARNAVEIADLVLLCFDSQSQQADEFLKVSNWVRELRKPAIAILNCRNSRWRLPTISSPEQRTAILKFVRDHASNIRDGLASIGILGAPIVAISTRRALFARATRPFRCPDGEGLAIERETYGDSLASISNFTRLEQHLCSSISRDALNIRIGALRGKIEGTFQGIISSLTEHRARTIEGARVISDSLEDLFRIFGYPSEVQKSRDRFFHEGKDAITELESLRQRRFSQSVDGSVGSTIAQLLEVYMSSLEAESLREAEKCVIEVFDRGIQLSEKELTKRVFKAESIDSAATTVMRETQEFINAKTSVALADAKFSFEILRLNHAKMDLSAGRVVRWISIGCKVTNMLGGIAATLGSLALANAWNPFGWAAGVASGVAAVGALVGLVFGFAGKKTASAAERKRLEARASGLSDLRESVRQTYAEIKSTVRKTLQESAQETLASLCKPLLLQAYTLIREKQVCDELIRAAETMSTNAKGRSPNSHSSASETDSHPAQGQEAALLLGEDWLGTPSDIEIKKAQDIWNAARPQFEALHANQERLLARFVHNVSEYDVQNWISHVHRFLEKDRFEPKLLADVCRIRNTSIPQISLMGDYNAGKTSFLRRLFFENRLQIPESLRVAGVPTTRSAESYDWGHLRFVDTPGFQSRNRRDTAVALQAAADSIGIFVFFLPNLLLGDDSALRKLLEGDPEAGVTSKRDRIVFVINRIDELGCDPLVSPKGFIALLHRKRIELSQALKSRLGVSVNPDEIICLSSDPFQSLFSGKTQELESDSRCWDGFAELVPALEKVSQKLEAKGNLIGHVDGILARLQRARARLSEVAHQKERELQDIEMLIGSFGRSLRSLENLRNAMSSELRTKIQLRLAELATNILKASNRQELMNRWQAIEDLSSDAELVSILNAWSIDTENQLEQWINQTGDELNRIFETQKWRNSTFRIHTQMECPAAEHGGRESLRTTIKVLKTTAGAATRETVLVVGKAIKFKFRPWQAVKIARFGAKATVVLAVVGNVLDVLTEIQEQRESREVERKRLKLRTELEILGESFVSKILDGDEEQPGLNPQLNEIQEKLKAERAQSETRCQKLRGQSFAISRKLKMYDELIRQGSRLLESRAEDFIDEKERRVG